MNNTLKKSVYLFMIPALLLYVVFWITPIIITFYYSFTNSNGFGNDFHYVGLRNYFYVLKDGSLVNSLKNTLVYAFFSIVLTNIIAVALALVLNMELRLKGVYRTFSYVPTLFSTIVVGFIWGYIYLPDYGMIATILKSVGIHGVELNLLGNSSTALLAIVMVDVWKSFGGVMVIYLAGLQSIPVELIEAGEIDGSHGWNLIRYIKLPLLAPAITINITLGLVGGMKQFDYIYTMTQGGPGKASRTLMFDMFRMAFTETLFGKASAFGVLSFVFILIGTFVIVKYLRAREIY